MQSGNGMTMQEAEQEIKYYQKIFDFLFCFLHGHPVTGLHYTSSSWH